MFGPNRIGGSEVMSKKPDIEGKWATGKQKKRSAASGCGVVAIRRGATGRALFGLISGGAVNFTEIASGGIADPAQMVVDRHEHIRLTRNAWKDVTIAVF